MAQFVRPTLEQSIQSGSLSVGRFTKVALAGATWHNTGSNAGGSAVLVASGATGNINLIDGGTIAAADFAGTGIPIECQPISITSGTGNIYVLYGASR